MQVTKGTWRMREQCVPGSLSSSHAQEPGNEARSGIDYKFRLFQHTTACMPFFGAFSFRFYSVSSI